MDFNDENILIDACRQKNATAQRYLYEKYYVAMFYMSLRYVKNRDEASDITNRSFVKVFEKIHKFKAEGSLEGWIKRIVLNTIFDFIRKNKSYKKRFISVSEISGYPVEEITEDEQDLITEVTEYLSYQELYRLIAELPPATRVVFNLYAVDGYKHKEIARELNIKEGTSKWHLKNARKLLVQKILKKVNEKKMNKARETRLFKY